MDSIAPAAPRVTRLDPEAALPPSAAELLAKIEDRRARVGVLGLGYVGLPLIVQVARAGFPVTGFDPDESKLEALGEGRSYVEDVPDADVAETLAHGKAELTSNFERLRAVDAMLVCVPTPLSKTREPDTRYLDAASEAIRKALRVGHLVVVESTTYPGTTDELVLPKLERTGLEAEREFFLAFSPERVDPQNPDWHIENTPKVVGGRSPASRRLAVALYQSFVQQVVPVSSTRTAEMVKMLENTFRQVNIGLINEIAIMCEKLGVDVWEVIEAAKTKPFGFMPFYPGPGLGGHCIPVDPLYLQWKLKTLNYRARFVELADHVNSTMPNYVTFRIAAVLNEDAKCVRGSKILVLGVAYKPGVSDVRESPAVAIVQHLRALGAEVSYHDPHVPSLDLVHPPLESTELDPEVLAAQDLVVLTTAHASVDYSLVAAHAACTLDCRNAMAGQVPAGRIVKL